MAPYAFLKLISTQIVLL